MGLNISGGPHPPIPRGDATAHVGKNQKQTAHKDK